MIRKQDVSLGVGWGGVGMMTYLALAHMFDDTQTGCFSRGGVGWGGDDDVPSTCTHVLCVTEPYPCIYYIHPQLP